MRGSKLSVIVVRGGNVELPASTEQRLIDRVREGLDDAALVIDRVVISVFEGPDGARSCSLDVHASATVQLTVREAAPFLNPAIDVACARTVNALGRIEGQLVRAFDAAARELVEVAATPAAVEE